MNRIAFTLCLTFSLACHHTVHDKATVKTIGSVAAHDVIEIEYDACPDVHDTIFLDAPPLAPATVTCLRALGVGAKVDVTIDASRNVSTKAYRITKIGTCEIPSESDGHTTTTGPARCAWN